MIRRVAHPFPICPQRKDATGARPLARLEALPGREALVQLREGR